MPPVTPQRDPRYPDFPTIVHALADAAARRGDAPAFACLDREITYAQYARAVAALARRFAEIGVAGERIAYLMAQQSRYGGRAVCRHGRPRAGGAAQSDL